MVTEAPAERSAAERSQVSDAQVAVLGSMLIDEACVGVLMRQLKPEDFPDSTARHVFEAIREQYLSGQPVDVVTVLGRLGKDYAPVLRNYMRQTPTAANCEIYAKILRDERWLASIQGACRRIFFDAGTLDEARALLAQAASLVLSADSGIREATYAELAADYVQRQQSHEKPDYLDFGIEEVNRQVHISPGRFVVLGADSSVGKTALALQFARHIARTKYVGFFSYETALEDAADRMMSNAAEIRLSAGKEHALDAKAFARAQSEAEGAGLRQLKVMETPEFTVDDIRAKTLAERFDVIFIDYAQLIPTDYKDAKDAVSYISKALHRMSQQLHVTVVALSQVTLPERKSDGSRRYISKEDLRESKQLKMDAEAILLLDMWSTSATIGDRILIVGKNKDGALGNVRLRFEPEYMRFSYQPPQPEKPKKKKKDEEEDDQIEGQTQFTEIDVDDKELPF